MLEDKIQHFHFLGKLSSPADGDVLAAPTCTRMHYVLARTQLAHKSTHPARPPATLVIQDGTACSSSTQHHGDIALTTLDTMGAADHKIYRSDHIRV